MVDYSKWDKMDFGSDDDDDDDSTEENNDSKQQPSVTRLNEPSRVTFGGGRATIHTPKITSNDETAAATAAAAEGVKNMALHSPRGSSSDSSDKPSSKKSAAAETEKNLFSSKSYSQDNNNNKDIIIKKWTKNGNNHDNKLYWCQDRNDVIIRYALPEGVTGKDVKVECKGALQYFERNKATSVKSDDASLKIIIKGIPILVGDLPYPIYLSEDDENINDNQIEWNIETSKWKTKYVVITLHKGRPMEGVTLWWKHPLAHLPEIDLKTIDAKDNSKAKQFQSAWNEAHEKFKSSKTGTFKVMAPACATDETDDDETAASATAAASSASATAMDTTSASSATNNNTSNNDKNNNKACCGIDRNVDKLVRKHYNKLRKEGHDMKQAMHLARSEYGLNKKEDEDNVGTQVAAMFGILSDRETKRQRTT